MSVVTYNGITLPDAYITQFTQTPARDEMGDVDWCLTKYEIRVQCLINASFLSMLAPDLVDDTRVNAAMVMAALRNRLMQHRKKLSVTFNNIELIPAKQRGVTGNVDAKNGPKPQNCIIHQLTNTTFMMDFHIVAYYWENPTDDANFPIGDDNLSSLENRRASDVIYNRWTERVSIDNCNYTTRTREGKYAIRSDNASGVVADYYRSALAVVGVPPGFTRVSSDYTVSADGLTLSYKVTDKENFKMPPPTAFEADGEYLESLGRMGAIRTAQVRVHLKGDRATSQNRLINVACLVGLSYLASRAVDLGNGWSVLESAAVRMNFYRNEVDATFRVFQAKSNQSIGLPVPFLGIEIPRVVFNNPFVPFVTITDVVPGSPISNNTYQPPYLDAGTSKYLVKAAQYFDPNIVAHQINNKGDMVPGKDIGTTGVNP